jgi:hypothetical protein
MIATVLAVVSFAVFLRVAEAHDAKVRAAKPSPIVNVASPSPCPKRIQVGSYVYELVGADPGELLLPWNPSDAEISAITGVIVYMVQLHWLSSLPTNATGSIRVK